MAVFSSGDTVNAIVADIGSSATKIGFAGEDYPRAYFRSNVATLRGGDPENTEETKKRSRRRRGCPIDKVHYDSLSRPMAGETDGNWQVSNPVDPTTGLWYDPRPHHDASYSSNSNSSNSNSNSNNASTSADWADLIPTFLQHGYEASLGLKDLTANPLLMVERSYNPPPLRQQLLEILMEEGGVPATFFGRDATLACYACARTTSTVVDIGYSGTTVTPVYEGYVEQKGIRRSPIGSLAMDELVLEQLQKVVSSNSSNSSSKELKPLYQVRNPKLAPREGQFHRLALLQMAKECRESGAGQSINTAVSKSLQVPSMSFTLPDGQTVDIPSQNRFAVADFLLGRSSTSTTTTSTTSSSADKNEPPSQAREDAVTALKLQYQSALSTASLPEEDDDDDDDEDDEEDDEDDDDDDEEEAQEQKKQQASKYTEATAVGVSSRRTPRGRPAKKSKAAAVAAATSISISTTQQQSKQKRKVRFDNRILQRACAPYLQTHMEQLTASPIADMVCDAAFRCDRDQQASVLGNVVLSGGGGCIGPTDQAVPDLLREQIEAIIHTHTPGWRVKVLSPSMQERAVCSWLGGSILGSLGTFHDMWITKAEYDEWGSAIVNRKCP